MDNVMREACMEMPQSMSFDYKLGPELSKWGREAEGSVHVQSMLYADDLALANDTPEKLQLTMDVFHKAAKRWGLEISVEKSKVMHCTARQASVAQQNATRRAECKGKFVCERENRYERASGLGVHNRFCKGKSNRTGSKPVASACSEKIKIGMSSLENVKDFPYLGSICSDDGSVSKDVSKRIEKAAISFWANKKSLWHQRNVFLKTKMKVFNSSVVSVLLYGSETWSIRKEDLQRLESFVLRCLRCILKVTLWHRIPNTEVRKRCGGFPTVEEMLRQRRLQWLGHIRRQKDCRLPKRLAFSKVTDGQRPAGRFVRWSNLITSDLQQRKCDEWWMLSADRPKWRRVIVSGRTR